jgi:hypothetical protein
MTITIEAPSATVQTATPIPAFALAESDLLPVTEIGVLLVAEVEDGSVVPIDVDDAELWVEVNVRDTKIVVDRNTVAIATGEGRSNQAEMLLQQS